MPTISQAISEGAHRLNASGVPEERRTAGLLLSNITSFDRTHILTESEERIGEVQYREYLALIDRRAAGEPLQYITGHQEFYSLDFVVTPDVLIPRPETEFLVERVIMLVEESRQETPLIVDVGTGSGCIAVAVATQLPGARIIATDVSGTALDVARSNAERHRVAERIEFLAGDLLEPLTGLKLEGSVDVIASNPPYVNEGRPELIQREVRDWEPPAALFGGADGLEFYRRLLADSLQYLRPGGYAVFEIGYSQLEQISNIIAASPWQLIGVTRDLQGIPRTLIVRSPEGIR